MKNNQINFYFLVTAIVFLILGLVNAKILTPLNKYWIKFGDILGKLVSPIVMFLIFFTLKKNIPFIIILILMKII